MINLAISVDIDDLDAGVSTADGLRFFVERFLGPFDGFGCACLLFGLAIGASIPSFSYATFIT